MWFSPLFSDQFWIRNWIRNTCKGHSFFFYTVFEKTKSSLFFSHTQTHARVLLSLKSSLCGNSSEVVAVAQGSQAVWCGSLTSPISENKHSRIVPEYHTLASRRIHNIFPHIMTAGGDFQSDNRNIFTPFECLGLQCNHWGKFYT